MQMQFMPNQRSQDQQMPIPQQFNQQMNQMIQHQQHQSGSNPASANHKLNKK